MNSSHFITLPNFVILMKTVKWVFVMIAFIIVYQFSMNSYHFYLFHQSFISQLQDLHFIEKNIKPALDLIIDFSIDLGKFILKLCLLRFVYFLIVHIPLPNIIFGQWHQHKEIGTILGRFLTRHFRYHQLCNIQDLMHYIHYAKIDRWHIIHHRSNPHLDPLFTAFDEQYLSDLDQQVE